MPGTTADPLRLQDSPRTTIGLGVSSRRNLQSIRIHHISPSNCLQAMGGLQFLTATNLSVIWAPVSAILLSQKALWAVVDILRLPRSDRMFVDTPKGG